jgi:hypothetical protein
MDSQDGILCAQRHTDVSDLSRRALMADTENQQIGQLLADVIDWAQAENEVLAVYLYGSQATGQAHALSDVDVAILLCANLSEERQWEIQERCASRWSDLLDIRVINLAPLPFRYEVTANGQCIWAADRGTLADQVSLIWRQYWDLRPLLERDWQCYVTAVMERKNETEREQYQAALAQVRAVHRRVRETAAGYARDVQE